MTISPATRLRRFALEVFGRLPVRLRRLTVQAISPHYVLGAVCVLRHGDEVLFLRSRHARNGWTLPGGLMARGERPREALARELCEELGLELDLADHPTLTLVEPGDRRVDLIFEVTVASRPTVRVDGTEILEARWVAPVAAQLDETTAYALDELARVSRPTRP